MNRYTYPNPLKCLPLLLVAVVSIACKPSTSASGPSSKRPAESSAIRPTRAETDASDLFFEANTIEKIFLSLSSDQESKLNENARQYVRCTLVQKGRTPLTDVGIKLKGAAGSFQELSGKPAFTVNISKYRKQQSFYAMKKFHLNNSVQDELYTNEWLCSTICRDAGVPAPRVTHVQVWLNDRDLGLYVLKEGFDERFLNRHFVQANGNLYDGGFCQDIDVDLEKDAGDGPNDFSDLHALREACCEEDSALRKVKIAQILDVPAFLSFMAMEMMACHWDGYVSNRNNYRVYFPTEPKRAHFLPHGMDQMFQDSGFQTFGETPSFVASALRKDPEWNLQFRKRVEEMLPLFEGGRLAERVRSLQKKLHETIMNLNPDGVESYEQQVAELIDRLQERYEIIARQLTEPDPPPPEPTTENIDNPNP